jgi:hypothetical protein
VEGENRIRHSGEGVPSGRARHGHLAQAADARIKSAPLLPPGDDFRDARIKPGQDEGEKD